MYRIAIVDDSREDLEVMKTMMLTIMGEESMECSIESYGSAGELTDARSRGGVWNLILLDIMMKEKDGIALSEELRGSGDETDLVFVTSSPEYALAGYRAYPVTYLLTPVKKQELRRAAKKCISHYRKEPALALPGSDGGMVSAVPDEIEYIEVFRKELVFHKRDDTVRAAGSLQGVLEELPKGKFYRCQRSFAVNLDFVQGINKYWFIMKSGKRVPVAMRSYGEAKRIWLDHLS